MSGTLGALHAASSEQRTGIFALTHAAASWRLRIELVRGWVHGFGIEPSPDPDPPVRPAERRQRDAELAARVAPAVPPQPAATRLAHLLALAVRERFVAESLFEARLPHFATTPFHPLAALRATVSTLLRPVEQEAAAQLESSRAYRLVAPLHASGLDPDEQAAVALLATSRSWSELVGRSRIQPQRLVVLLRDAAALGALRMGEDDPTPRFSLLMIEAPAEAARRRAEYHAQARAVHPDLHPGTTPEEARRLNDEMAELAAKHRR